MKFGKVYMTTTNSSNSYNIKFKHGFTLAEVLITLGIIGIVAALTLPSLVNNIQNREKVSGVKKAYSILSQATLFAVNENGDAKNWYIEDKNAEVTKLLFSYYKPYLKVIKFCDEGKSGCWVNEVKDLMGNRFHWYTAGIVGVNSVSARLTDGMTLTFDVFRTTTNDLGVTVSNDAIVFFIDINGEKKPNQFGYDIFTFVLDAEHNAVVPAGKDNDSKWCSKSSNASYNYAGIDCAAKVLKEDKISY